MSKAESETLLDLCAPACVGPKHLLKGQIFGRPAVGRSGEISKWDPSSGRLCAQAGAQVWHLSGGEIFRHLSDGEGF